MNRKGKNVDNRGTRNHDQKVKDFFYLFGCLSILCGLLRFKGLL